MPFASINMTHIAIPENKVSIKTTDELQAFHRHKSSSRGFHKEKIELFRETLNLSEIRWVPLENLHITLKFIGPVTIHKLDEIHQRLLRLPSHFFPLQIGIKSHGLFFHHKQPSILWLGIDENDKLLDLTDFIQNDFSKAGLKKDVRPIHPHITIARIPENVITNKKNALLKSLQTLPLTETLIFKVNSLSLFQSILTPKGSRYISLGNFPVR